MTSDALRMSVERWIADDPDPATQDELRALLALPDLAATDLPDRFAGGLKFGTAGLRGVIGAGPNRMNRAVVARATWALARELIANVPHAKERVVVVGGDGRRMSAELSEDVVAILAGAGLRVLRFRDPVPTPLVGFAVKRFSAAGGVVITASHNPPEYNGYKVYWENAAQIAPPVDARIAAAIDRAPAACQVPRPDLRDEIIRSLVTDALPEIAAAYLDALRGLCVHPDEGDRDLAIVYTPLHGVGDVLVRSALSRAGFSRVTSVPEQQKPDGAFPTVAFPNPEEPGSMDLALALAREMRADLVLANDPDADRLAVAVRDDGAPGGYLQLSGNQVGVLLGHYLLTEKASITHGARGGRVAPRVVIASIVSSPLLGRIAASLGVRYEETLTGFKWIANRAIELNAEGYEFVFGYEEALGYGIGDVVYDKDGISAALLAAELAAVLRRRGRTLQDELDRIACRWGAYASTQRGITKKGAEGAAAISRLMERLRTSPPLRVADDRVIGLADYQARVRTDMATGVRAPLVLPMSNVLTFDLASGGRIIVRPSGTEPKVKFYFDVREEVRPGEPAASAGVRAGASMLCLADAFLALALGEGQGLRSST